MNGPETSDTSGSKAVVPSTAAPPGMSNNPSPDHTQGLREALNWPEGDFGVHDPDPNDDHGPIYLICPGGLMLNTSSDPTPGLDAKRTTWMAKSLNAALAPPADWSAYEDDIADAISDSMDMDWTSHDGARAVVRCLNDLALPSPRSREGDEADREMIEGLLQVLRPFNIAASFVEDDIASGRIHDNDKAPIEDVLFRSQQPTAGDLHRVRKFIPRLRLALAERNLSAPPLGGGDEDQLASVDSRANPPASAGGSGKGSDV